MYIWKMLLPMKSLEWNDAVYSVMPGFLLYFLNAIFICFLQSHLIFVFAIYALPFARGGSD